MNLIQQLEAEAIAAQAKKIPEFGPGVSTWIAKLVGRVEDQLPRKSI